ncbi:MAG: inositol monophosphatase [Gammaproteobacteria bacterium]|nr:inositol monophosphatase [Gammaproteobacteria bacterium]
MQNSTLKRLEKAGEIAQSAGRLAVNYFAKRGHLTIDNKGLQDRVTEADQAVEQLIFEQITAAFPEDGFLGEETSPDRPTKLVDKGTWVVDPIDGTDCFIYGMPNWCISIAWVQHGKPTVGVIYDPVHDELFSAAIGQGAKVNGNSMKVSDTTELAGGMTGMGYSTRVESTTILVPLQRLIKGGGMFNRTGSAALSLAWVADGRLIAYYEPHLNSWDCLAGIVLVREAGGRVNNFLAGDGLTNGNPILACAPGIADKMEIVSQLEVD